MADEHKHDLDAKEEATGIVHHKCHVKQDTVTVVLGWDSLGRYSGICKDGPDYGHGAAKGCEMIFVGFKNTR
jgi:hypothetical protein